MDVAIRRSGASVAVLVILGWVAVAHAEDAPEGFGVVTSSMPWPRAVVSRQLRRRRTGAATSEDRSRAAASAS